MKKGINSHGLNQVTSDNIKVHRSFQGCGYSVQNFFDVICMLHRIRRRLQDFWKVSGPLHLLSDLNVCSWENVVVSDLT